MAEYSTAKLARNPDLRETILFDSLAPHETIHGYGTLPKKRDPVSQNSKKPPSVTAESGPNLRFPKPSQAVLKARYSDSLSFFSNPCQSNLPRPVSLDHRFTRNRKAQDRASSEHRLLQEGIFWSRRRRSFPANTEERSSHLPWLHRRASDLVLGIDHYCGRCYRRVQIV